MYEFIYLFKSYAMQFHSTVTNSVTQNKLQICDHKNNLTVIIKLLLLLLLLQIMIRSTSN